MGGRFFRPPSIHCGHTTMGFNIECPNEFDGTDVPVEGDNNNTCVMNNGRDVPNIWTGTNIRYG